jgi:hypothetical protein
MTLQNARDWLRKHGGEVRLLADRGHVQAQAVIAAHLACWEANKLIDRKAFEAAAANLIAVLHDFIIEHLTIHSRRELEQKFEVDPATGLILH